MPIDNTAAVFRSDEETDSAEKDRKKMDLLGDIYLPVSIELGRTTMIVHDILDLEKGSIIEFDKLAGETVDLLVNNQKFAEGEVVVIDEHFGIRITILIRTADLLKEMNK